MKKFVVIQFSRFGPYHLSRISSAHKILAENHFEVIGLETAGDDATYAWQKESKKETWKRTTLFPNQSLETVSPSLIRASTNDFLDRISPSCVVIAGWGSVDARACLTWCRKNRRRAIVMSETRWADGPRVWWKEWVKSRIIKQFDGGLVGAKSHADYLVKLGVSPDRIDFCYNVVNNAFFRAASAKWRKSKGTSADRFLFLASNRFVKRKNLASLLDAFAQATEDFAEGDGSNSERWDLCLLGDGDEKTALIERCRELGLAVVEGCPWQENDGEPDLPFNRGVVWFPGFRQIAELPRFYALADCFIHPALEEPWGLVVNEAMASGLPILCGSNVGAAEELIDEGVNGWIFDANQVSGIRDAMIKMMQSPQAAREEMGRLSDRLIEERCPTSAFGNGLARLLAEIPSSKL